MQRILVHSLHPIWIVQTVGTGGVNTNAAKDIVLILRIWFKTITISCIAQCVLSKIELWLLESLLAC